MRIGIDCLRTLTQIFQESKQRAVQRAGLVYFERLPLPPVLKLFLAFEKLIHAGGSRKRDLNCCFLSGHLFGKLKGKEIGFEGNSKGLL